MNTPQVFYENGAIIEELLKVLEKEAEQPIIKMDIDTIRIYKFIISAEMWQYGKRKATHKMYISLKEGIANAAPSIQNKVFCEKMEEKDLDFYYFSNYLDREINTMSFWNIYRRFCRNVGIINETKIA